MVWYMICVFVLTLFCLVCFWVLGWYLVFCSLFWLVGTLCVQVFGQSRGVEITVREWFHLYRVHRQQPGQRDGATGDARVRPVHVSVGVVAVGTDRGHQPIRDPSVGGGVVGRVCTDGGRGGGGEVQHYGLGDHGNDVGRMFPQSEWGGGWGWRQYLLWWLEIVVEGCGGWRLWWLEIVVVVVVVVLFGLLLFRLGCPLVYD